MDSAMSQVMSCQLRYNGNGQKASVSTLFEQGINSASVLIVTLHIYMCMTQ